MEELLFSTNVNDRILALRMFSRKEIIDFLKKNTSRDQENWFTFPPILNLKTNLSVRIDETTGYILLNMGIVIIGYSSLGGQLYTMRHIIHRENLIDFGKDN